MSAQQDIDGLRESLRLAREKIAELIADRCRYRDEIATLSVTSAALYAAARKIDAHVGGVCDDPTAPCAVPVALLDELSDAIFAYELEANP